MSSSLGSKASLDARYIGGPLSVLLDTFLEGAALGTFYATHTYDIAGARRASQWGMLYYAAREALTLGSLTYLASLGVRLGPAEDIEAALEQRPEAGLEIAARFRSLHGANPITDNDVVRYAEDVTAFVERVLAVPSAGMTIGQENPQWSEKTTAAMSMLFQLMQALGRSQLAEEIAVATDRLRQRRVI